MNSTVKHSRSNGFTLVELLVVISIIVILASMGFGAGMVAIQKARKTQAKKDCTDLVTAVSAYFDDYSHLPNVPSAGSGNGALTDEAVMNILVGFNTRENPKETRFYQGKQSSATSASAAYGGLFYSGNNVELFDPWRKTGNQVRHYYLLLDNDYDDELADPTENSLRLYGRQAAAWSTGQDGDSSTSAKANRDNVYSWK